MTALSLAPLLRVADAFAEAALFVSGDGTILAANRSSRTIGIPIDVLLGRRLEAVATTPSGSTGDLLRAWNRNRTPIPGVLSFDGGQTLLHCYGCLLEPAHDGDPALLLVRLAPKSEAAGQFRALSEKVADLKAEIRRRVQTEAELDRERRQLETTLQSIGDAVIVTDPHGIIRSLNPVAAALTGWTAEEAVGTPLTEVFNIINDFTREPVSDPVASVLETGRIVGLPNHTLLVAKDGTEHAIDDSAAPIRDQTGSLHGVVLIFRDITDQKQWIERLERSKQELELADRRKDEFLAMLAHELRNPLAPLLTGLQILQFNPLKSEVVEPMRYQVEHLIRLLDDLLDVSRILRNRVTLQLERVALDDVLERSIAAVMPLVEERHHTLTRDFGGQPLWVEGDAVRLVQVFSNLLHNAAKYTVRPGRIRVRATAVEDRVEVTVSDNGIGLDSVLAPQVFDLFTQGERTIDRTQGGLGVGLTVVRSLVEMHGGTVRASSPGLGRGSVFTVLLPRRAPPTPSQPDRPAIPATIGRRVLIVDDNEPAAELLGMLLTSLGDHTVDLAADGPSAVEIALARRPEIVILDIGLPKMDGYEVARRLRADPGLSDALIVALTGYGSEDDRKRSVAAGFDAHYVKPLTMENLLAVLDHPKLARPPRP